MDMQAQHPEPLIFHLTGRRHGEDLAAIEGLGLRPALLAAYRNLDRVRHDFPVVLAAPGAPQAAQPLSSLVDRLLRDVAPRGIDGERLRRHGLQVEQEIRAAVAAGQRGTLAELWDAAAARLGAREGETLERVLVQAGAALAAEGEVLGCSHDMPPRLLRHAWQAACDAKARRLRTELARLVGRLSDILRAAHIHSQAGCAPDSLKSALGGAHREAFDFDALSRIVGKGAPQDELPAPRRERLERTLHVLESQRFIAATDAGADAAHGFGFADCASAAQAFRARLPALAELVRAMSIAELEAAGRYVESEHDLFFDAFDQHQLGADDLARFPDYLVCIAPERNDAPENAMLMELLSSGMPMKLLVQVTDLLEEAAVGVGHYAFGVRSARLATTAMGLGGMFVLQAPCSQLVAMQAQLARGMACHGPALFCVYTPPVTPADPVAPYLSAAAALQSRAFPAFCYDATAGSNWAERFSLAHNPQPEGDWPVETLEYADAALQRCSELCAFTYADFVLCDPRQAAHFALVPRQRWGPQMVAAADWLQLADADAARHVPYLLAVDANDGLQRVIVDLRLMQAARRCLLLWHRLQEHGGIHDSHAERLLAREKAAWAGSQQPAAAAPAAPAAVAAEAATAVAEVEPPAASHSRDEAWIETARCPSCNECQIINDRMFTYNERKQAYIKDLSAGTYRQLVEAAEGCQVAIIHPGKPRDPNEPGLEELLARAEPFR